MDKAKHYRNTKQIEIDNVTEQMSTILKTLKKLEEDKSVLEKKLDLKELVLQDGDNVDIDTSISQNFIWKSGLLLVGIVLGMVCQKLRIP